MTFEVIVSEFKNNPNLRPSRGTPLRRLPPRREPELAAGGEVFPPAKAPSLGRILNVDEIAKLFGKSRETVKRKLRLRKLHGFKFFGGKDWYILEADLLQDILRASGRHSRHEEEQ